ncbi:hypothetical protein [Bradyrhizobium diazoefficiens]|uniref:hypothetical protein n=1 Tax=Bradyrhizobium diazoefficiens TaxID=1355477 RepID=UPI0027150A3F|nr:hypothetical protein [Bradyrhizobium diazoefficiens]WLC16633.1 hypothetical protein QIH76_42365 [Bradyrhizobium diazoefficiens]
MLSTNFADRVLEFFGREDVRNAMAASIAAGVPPHAGTTPFVNVEFPDMTDAEKTTMGKLQRQVLEGTGYAHDQYDVPIKVKDCQFTRGSTYVKRLPIAA